MDLRRVPVFPLNTVLYPGTRMPLRVFEPRYHAMLERLLAAEDPVFIVASTTDPEVGAPADPARVGCLARVLQASPEADVRFVLVEGERRTLTHKLYDEEPYLEADAAFLPEEPGARAGPAARDLRQVIQRFLPVLDCTEDEISTDPVAFAYQMAAVLPLNLHVRQRLLECADATERLTLETQLVCRLAPRLEEALRARNAPWN